MSSKLWMRNLYSLLSTLRKASLPLYPSITHNQITAAATSNSNSECKYRTAAVADSAPALDHNTGHNTVRTPAIAHVIVHTANMPVIARMTGDTASMLATARRLALGDALVSMPPLLLSPMIRFLCRARIHTHILLEYNILASPEQHRGYNSYYQNCNN